MKYNYYPGCSLERNAFAYHQSTLAIAGPLGIEFEEIEDWNCCGATEYTSINLLASYALITRNLALAEKNADNHKLVAPCSACFLNLTKVNHNLIESPELAEKVNTALAAGGLHYTPGSQEIYHLLEILFNEVGLDTIQTKVTKPGSNHTADTRKYTNQDKNNGIVVAFCCIKYFLLEAHTLFTQVTCGCPHGAFGANGFVAAFTVQTCLNIWVIGAIHNRGWVFYRVGGNISHR